MNDQEIADLADELRKATVAIRMGRVAIGAPENILPWPQLTEAERAQWVDIAKAAREVFQ